jgi:pyruvate,water dikinase
MWRLSRLDPESEEFRHGFDEFVREYGSRGPNEWEMRSPTWETDPDLALTAIDRMRRAPAEDSPTAHHAAVAGDRERLGAEVLQKLAGDPEAAGQVGAALHAAAVFLPGRERSKTTIIRLVHECRMAMRELGHRLVERGAFEDAGDFAFLREDELDELVADPGSVAGRAAARKAWYAELAEREPPFIVVGEPTRPAAWPRRGEVPVEAARTGDVLVGIPGCPGTATGRARVLHDPGDPTVLEPGDVLVAPITDPSWTPLFVPAAAVVVDVGAQLSHAVIVCRELGIPCVVSVTDATRRIADGASVTVDGTTGTVTVVEAPALTPAG